MDKITNDLVNEFIGIINTEENQTKLRYFAIDPVLKYISNKIYPYFITLSVLLVVNIIFLVIIIYFLTRQRS